MYIMGNVIGTIAALLHTIINIYTFVIIIASLLSWVNPDPYNPIVRVLRSLTEPVFDKVRRLIPFTQMGNLDLTPLIVLLFLFLLDGAVVQSLADFARRM